MIKEILKSGITSFTSLMSNPDFLIGAGIGIMVVGEITSFIEGTKSQEEIHKKTDELGREMTKPEKVAVHAKHALLPAVEGLAGGAMVVVGTRKKSKTIQLLTASLQAATLYSNTQGEKITKLEDAIKEKLGEKSGNEVINKPAMDRFVSNPPIVGTTTNIWDTGKGNRGVIFQFGPTGEYFWSSYEQVRSDALDFNKIFSGGSATMSDLRECLGLPSDGTIDQQLFFTFNGDLMDFNMETDTGFIEVDGVMKQYCLLTFNKQPSMY